MYCLFKSSVKTKRGVADRTEVVSFRDLPTIPYYIRNESWCTFKIYSYSSKAFVLRVFCILVSQFSHHPKKAKATPASLSVSISREKAAMPPYSELRKTNHFYFFIKFTLNIYSMIFSVSVWFSAGCLHKLQVCFNHSDVR